MNDFAKYLLESGLAPACFEAEGIADDAAYLAGMAKTFPDKAWFVRYAPRDVRLVVDFGGGTGDFCEYVRGRMPAGVQFAVIDNNPSFLARAEEKGLLGYSSIEEYEVEAAAAQREGRSLLVMSSVIHEVYSYSDEFYDDVGQFWDSLGGCGFDYVAIRDMAFDEEAAARMPREDAAWVCRNLLGNPESGLSVKGRAVSDQFADFEGVWGPVCGPDGSVDARRLMHFLFKYRYVENWARELREDYLPLTQGELEAALRGIGYRLVHREQSRLHWYMKTWAAELGLGPGCAAPAARFAKWLAGVATHIKWLAAR